MALNFVKGTAYSLLQSDFRGNLATSGTIVPGAIVRLDPTTQNILLGSSVTTELVATADLLGIALNSDLDGDCLESGKLAASAFDGNSVIQTDQVSGTISTSNYPVGTFLTANSSGQFTTATVGTHKLLGVVEGVGTIPGVATTITSAGYTNTNGVVVAGVATGVQAPITVLTIKLLAA